MSQAEVVSSEWPQVETGRVVIINSGKDEGKLAAVVQIIDHKRALIDSPHIERQEISLSHVSLTPQVITKLPRAARGGAVTKYWTEAGVDAKAATSTSAKKRANRDKKRQLTDFERFKVMVLKKQRRFEVRKAVAKARKSS
ncbi:hypothetical protein ABW20_dc0108771 [Dactylellina cionopaga]|nr:hypothetical protein ABW20_dc0108771 [Dactylellina cionopaga]